MKVCTKCGEEKALAAFYVDKTYPCGYRPECASCTRALRRARRAAGHGQATDRARYHRSARLRAQIAANTKRWKARNREKLWAQHVIAHEIRVGGLVRQACEVEGCETKAHAHHADYSKPLEVRWLCPLHHARAHVAEGRLDHLRVPA